MLNYVFEENTVHFILNHLFLHSKRQTELFYKKIKTFFYSVRRLYVIFVHLGFMLEKEKHYCNGTCQTFLQSGQFGFLAKNFSKQCLCNTDSHPSWSQLIPYAQTKRVYNFRNHQNNLISNQAKLTLNIDNLHNEHTDTSFGKLVFRKWPNSPWVFGPNVSISSVSM